MKLRFALIAAVLFAAGPALAQAPPAGTQQKPPAPAQPAPAQPAPQAAAQPPTDEKVDPAKDAAIRHLFEVTDTSKMGERFAEGINADVHSAMGRALPPDRLDKFMAAFSEKFNAAAPPSAVTDSAVTIYARHFSMEDIQGLTKFYESPLGQRVVKTMPVVSQESQNAGLQMDQKAALAVLRTMTDDYPELKQMLPPDPTKPAAAPTPATAPDSAPAPKPAPAPPQQ